MRAGRALELLERGLGELAYASVFREAATVTTGAGRSFGGAEQRGSVMEWSVLVTAPDYEQRHRGRTLADAVAEALAAFHSAHVVHGVNELEFAEAAAGTAMMTGTTAHLPPAA